MAKGTGGKKDPKKDMKKADEGTKKAIMAVREEMERAEEAKDRIIAFLERKLDQNDNTRGMWIGDAKEAYYNIVAAWEMLRMASEGKDEHMGQCRAFLAGARDRLGCSLSELRALKDDEAKELESMFGLACERSINRIDELLRSMTPTEPLEVPLNRVVVKGPKEIELLCQVCGKVSMTFKMGEFYGSEGLIFTGVTHQTSLGQEDADLILELLRKDDVSKVHDIAKGTSVAMEDGLDGYCPECDRVYCGDHIKMEVEWDDGFYDCTYGTCPAGHRRIIDD